MKNMLMVVILLASQTLRRSATLADFRQVFIGRVQALAASYALLTRENWVSIRLHDLVEEELRPFVAQEHNNIGLGGVEVQLGPAGALALDMEFHALVTSAAKYGLLLVPDGQMDIAWHIQGGYAEPALSLLRSASGDPAFGIPQHMGFGTTLILRSLSDELAGHADLAFFPDGLRATLCAPLVRKTRGLPANVHGDQNG